jgi:sec-independent protein translocase protein TatB
VRRYIASVAPRLANVFNIEGSELIFLLLIALVVLGPEKLPEAVRKFTKGYAEFKKMASGFQGEMRNVLDEPLRELRGTADAVRAAAKFDLDPDAGSAADSGSTSATPGVSKITREKGLNFGSAAPRQAPTPRREPGLNFGSANPRKESHSTPADDADDGPTPGIPADTTPTTGDSGATAVEDTKE